MGLARVRGETSWVLLGAPWAGLVLVYSTFDCVTRSPHETAMTRLVHPADGLSLSATPFNIKNLKVLAIPWPSRAKFLLLAQ